MKILLLLIIFNFSFALINCKKQTAYEREYAKIAGVQATQKEDLPQTLDKNSYVRPIFIATELAGKNEGQVNKILGKPIDAWVTRDVKGRMCEYALGEQTIVEFQQNRIKSLVTFFAQKDIDRSVLFQRVGLKPESITASGISDITARENWIKIIYR